MLRLTAPRHSLSSPLCNQILCSSDMSFMQMELARSRTLLSAAPGKITLFQHKTHIAARAAAGTAVMCNHFIGSLCEFLRACSYIGTSFIPDSIYTTASDADPLVKCISYRSRVRDRKEVIVHTTLFSLQSAFSLLHTFLYKDKNAKMEFFIWILIFFRFLYIWEGINNVFETLCYTLEKFFIFSVWC